jgi:hypothetical protein
MSKLKDAPRSAVQEFAEDPAKMLAAAETALFRLAAGAGDSAIFSMDSEDKQLFAALQWTPSRVDREVARVREVLELQPIAGSAADLAATECSATSAREALAAHDRRRERIAADLAEAEEMLSRRRTARRRLRQLAPEHVRGAHQAALAALRAARGNSDLASYQQRLQWCRVVVASPYGQEASGVAFAERVHSWGKALPVDHPARAVWRKLGTGQGEWFVSREGYDQLQRECEQELRTAHTAATGDAVQNAIDAQLDVYLPA